MIDGPPTVRLGERALRFHADLHVHSKYSRATSRDLDLEHLAFWAARKGIALVATGDFTHPAWREELKAKLVPAEPGLFRLRSEIERDTTAQLPPACQATARFMLSVEISTIYKKGDRTRKIHHLLYAPDFETADRIATSLARIGNIASDGRPILGLDSRNLLEITLEAGPGAYLVPAHIWTPWFAALGSMSGFDSIADCYGDLADHIFAVETGLSSDPPMNWRLSMLDRYRLVSNSDAHSPGKLGREATTFDTDLDYFAVRRALETGEGYAGTVEFFPEEGKYHLDGHRKCGTRTLPAETRAHGLRCPVCGQPTTVGVLHRVETLADRGEAEATPPSTAGAVSNLVPLPEVLGELLATGPASKRVGHSYDRLLATLGAELSILEAVPVEDIARTSSTLLAEAVARLRAGRVIRDAGYDGEYGTIRLFDEAELRRLTAGGALFDVDPAPSAVKGRGRAAKAAVAGETTSEAPALMGPPTAPAGSPVSADAAEASGPEPAQPALRIGEAGTLAGVGILAPLDPDQRRAAEMVDGPLIVIAGPGSGKTRTLTHRLAYLVAARGVPASACLAVTFTRRAAAELSARLARLLPGAPPVAVHTFHSLGLAILREHGAAVGLHREFRVATEGERTALLAERLSVTPPRAARLLEAISRAKRTVVGAATAEAAGDDVAEALAEYQEALAVRNWVDFDDLVVLAAEALDADPETAARCRERFRRVSVDEFQDVDAQQYRLLTRIAPPGSHPCVIGDPRQAIYGFRGADASSFDRFAREYAPAVVELTRNYRSTGTIVAASAQVIGSDAAASMTEVVRELHDRITIHTAPTERAEAEFVVQTLERLLGGHSFFSIDSGRGGEAGAEPLGFGDVAVLYRTTAQAGPLIEALSRSGLPFGTHSHEALVEQPAVQALLGAWEEERAAGSGADLANQLRQAGARLARRRAAASDADVNANVGADARAGELALHQLLVVAQASGNDPERFADALALATDADFWDPRAERIALLTLHAAKGLEFPVVFIVGLEDGLLPLHWGTPDEATAAEERRLCYVGMTRAKTHLFLSRAERRLWRGQVRTPEPSPFLRDIEAELVRHQQAEIRSRPAEQQLRLL